MNSVIKYEVIHVKLTVLIVSQNSLYGHDTPMMFEPGFDIDGELRIT